MSYLVDNYTLSIATKNAIMFFCHQRALFTQLSGGEDEFNSKEAQLLVSILGVLSRQLKPSSKQVGVLTQTHFT